MKVSIIIPVYNTQNFIAECLESIINQDYKNLEIIIIDDGSTDNSKSICDTYQLKDDRIKVIHTENLGVSTARNLGMDIATGDYISFIDSDDWIDQGMYSNIANKLSSDIDLVYFSKIDSNFYIENKIYTKNEIRNYILKYFIGCSSVKAPLIATVWSLVISRKLINCLRFENISVTEDKIFFIELLLKTNSLLAIKSQYNYRDNPCSTLNTYNKNYSKDITQSNIKIKEILEINDIYNILIAEYHNNTILRYFYSTIKNEAKNKNFNKNIKNVNIENYYILNNIDKILTWTKVVKLSMRNPKWILIKLKKYNYLITLLNK